MNNTFLGMNILDDFSIDVRYNIADLPIYIQEEHLSDFPQMRNFSHWNDELEIVYVCEGRMQVVSNGRKTIVPAGSICMINPGCVHAFESIQNENCTYQCYIVDRSLFTNRDDVLHHYIHPLFHSFYPSLHLMNCANSQAARIKDLLEQISFIARNKEPAYEIHIVGLLNILIAQLYQTAPELFTTRLNHNARFNDSMRQMLTFIHEHYSQSIRIEELCAAGSISRSQCFSYFKRFTDDTPSRFILKFRLGMAKNLLTNTTLSIAQIATSCGFTHQSHLTSHFTHYYGITPRNYRKSKHTEQLL